MKRNSQADGREIVIKRYGNRRLYNTETGAFVKTQDLVDLIRSGFDIQVMDSRTGEDVTKVILTQIILEEEKSRRNMLPTAFLYQLIRYQGDSVQDFFQNYLAASFDAYLRTKQEFDRRFRGWLEMGAQAPQMWGDLFPGVLASESPEAEPPPATRRRRQPK
jgi:polyhydroxyalkanoate synthesis repressor PhaR